MEVFRGIKEIQQRITELRAQGLSIGFVPTMGALHDGHASLIRTASAQCDVVVCSIYVNPTQFDNKEDLEKYPETLGEDITLVALSGGRIIFAPSSEEMYGNDMTTVEADYGLLTSSLEGAHRDGHFEGVVTIVGKLFEAVRPDKAFFGEKDFQQLSIIKAFVASSKIKIEIIGCKIIRDQDGLALSSRNRRLSEEDRLTALTLSATLNAVSQKMNEKSPRDLVIWAQKELNQNAEIDLEYFEILNSDTFETIDSWDDAQNIRALVAAWVGGVRLIDNIDLIKR